MTDWTEDRARSEAGRAFVRGKLSGIGLGLTVGALWVFWQPAAHWPLLLVGQALVIAMQLLLRPSWTRPR